MIRPTISMLLLCLLSGATMPSCPTTEAKVPTAARYTVTDIGTLGGTNSFAYAVNSSGMLLQNANHVQWSPPKPSGLQTPAC